MTILYSSLARTYHEMYSHIFDYAKEFDFYNSWLKKEGCRKILEIGCGSGVLARHFLKNGYDYLGLDLNNEMLDIAREESGCDVFIQADMRDLPFGRKFDAVLITGRSLAYVTDNKGIMATFSGIHDSLNENGLFIFGIFEANSIFDNLNGFEQVFELPGKKIKRTSSIIQNLLTGWTYDWHATYTIQENGETTVHEDNTTLRAFTRDEILLFLKLNGFRLIETIDEGKTLTLIAGKNENYLTNS